MKKKICDNVIFLSKHLARKVLLKEARKLFKSIDRDVEKVKKIIATLEKDG